MIIRLTLLTKMTSDVNCNYDLKTVLSASELPLLNLSFSDAAAPETRGPVFGTSFSILEVPHWLPNLGTDSSFHGVCLDNIFSATDFATSKLFL